MSLATASRTVGDIPRVLTRLRRQGDHPCRDIRCILRSNVVLHLLEKADKGLALGGRLFALEDRHEHVDALFREGIRSVPGSTPT